MQHDHPGQQAQEQVGVAAALSGNAAVVVQDAALAVQPALWSCSPLLWACGMLLWSWACRPQTCIPLYIYLCCVILLLSWFLLQLQANSIVILLLFSQLSPLGY
jgi:hypothetical protein